VEEGVLLARRPRAPLGGRGGAACGPCSRTGRADRGGTRHAVTRTCVLAAIYLAAVATASFAQSKPAGDCGEVVTIPTHDRTTTRYAFTRPAAPQGETIAVVLLPGGGGHLDLDAKGCPQALQRHSLVRSLP